MSFAKNMGLCLFSATLLSSAPAAGQPNRLSGFDSISVESGGEVVVRPGPAHAVRILSGGPNAITVTSNERGLRIRGCEYDCRGADPRIEVVTPQVEALAVHGGGRIAVAEGFAPQRALTLAVHGGGSIQTAALSAMNITASISGGGEIDTRPGKSLVAAVHGGGIITYSGSPQIASSVHGGGAIRKVGSN